MLYAASIKIPSGSRPHRWCGSGTVTATIRNVENTNACGFLLCGPAAMRRAAAERTWDPSTSCGSGADLLSAPWILQLRAAAERTWLPRPGSFNFVRQRSGFGYRSLDPSTSCGCPAQPSSLFSVSLDFCRHCCYCRLDTTPTIIMDSYLQACAWRNTFYCEWVS